MLNVRLPDCWEKVNLGAVLSFIGNGLTQKQDKTREGYPVTRIETISDDCINAEKVGYVNTLPNAKIEKYRLCNGDILVSHINSDPQLGRAVIYEGKPEVLLHGMNLLRMRANTKTLDPFFLNFIFRFYRNRGVFIALASRAVGQASINQSRMKSLIIPLPPLPEQRAIAHVLQTIQEAKAARQREIELERERKAALMDYLFSHGTKNERRKQTEIGEIPESWEILRLGEIVTLQRGKDLPVQSRHAEDIPIVGSNGIVGWHNESVENVPVPGVATGRSGSIGLLTYIDQPYWPLNTALYVRDFHGNNPLFIYYWLHLFPFEKYSQGVSVPTLNRNLVHPVPFRLPSLPEQTEIAEILHACDDKIAALDQEADRLDELFHAMLDELMTGKRSSVPLIDKEISN